MASRTARAPERSPRDNRAAASARQRRSKPSPKAPPGRPAAAASTVRAHSFGEVYAFWEQTAAARCRKWDAVRNGSQVHSPLKARMVCAYAHKTSSTVNATAGCAFRSLVQQMCAGAANDAALLSSSRPSRSTSTTAAWVHHGSQAPKACPSAPIFKSEWKHRLSSSVRSSSRNSPLSARSTKSASLRSASASSSGSLPSSSGPASPSKQFRAATICSKRRRSSPVARWLRNCSSTWSR
mmetsp:Transcript_129560/g.375273  ORF Transcript_129560/g.375273 Transcript_129560/m.375273 type:complete len:239 (-) Transcript_129560:196-912(-)